MNNYYEIFRNNFPYISREENTLKDVISNKDNIIIEEKNNNELLGFAIINKNTILLLFVFDKYRKQGIGTKLLNKCERIIKDNGYDKLVIGVGFNYLAPGIPTSKKYVDSVVVLKNSNYNKLDDLNDKLMGYVTIDENKDKYSSLLKSKITVELKSYDNVFKLYDSLINKETDSIIINEAYLDLLQEEYSDINDKIKVIYNLEIESKLNNDSDKIKELKPVNILISGSDSRSGQIISKTRSDVNMIMTIDPKNHKILLTSIPRDYYVRLHGTSGNKDKLTHAGIYGINMTKETIEDLFDIKIDYTIKVGFRTVEEIVDYIGGIEIDSDRSFTAWGNGAKIEKGKHLLDGKQALGYARERHAYQEGDNRRIQNQQQVLEAIISKVVSQKSLLKRYDELLELFSELYRTDIPSDFIKLIVKDQLNSMKSWKVEKQQVTGEGAKRETYSMPGRDLYVAIPDMDSVKEAREKILSIIDGD